MPYIIHQQVVCDHCDGTGSFYEEDPSLPVSYISYPCPLCTNGLTTREVDADEWLQDRLRGAKITSYKQTDFGPKKRVENPFKDVEIQK